MLRTFREVLLEEYHLEELRPDFVDWYAWLVVRLQIRNVQLHFGGAEARQVQSLPDVEQVLRSLVPLGPALTKSR